MEQDFKTNKELVDYLNSLKITQKNSWDEDIPENIWETYFKGKLKTIDAYLDVDKHRWYETSVEVLKNEKGIIGVRSVTDCFSEMSSIEDMFWTLTFFEMEEVLQPTYIVKK